MSYPRYRGDGAVIDRPDQSIPIADGGARSSWMACWNNPLMEPFDAIVAIPMTRELRHKRLHIATVAKASRGWSECDAMDLPTAICRVRHEAAGHRGGDFGTWRHKAKRPLGYERDAD